MSNDAPAMTHSSPCGDASSERITADASLEQAIHEVRELIAQHEPGLMRMDHIVFILNRRCGEHPMLSLKEMIQITLDRCFPMILELDIGATDEQVEQAAIIAPLKSVIVVQNQELISIKHLVNDTNKPFVRFTNTTDQVTYRLAFSDHA